jgi:hypothetical protein
VQLGETLPWDWELEHYPTLVDELRSNSSKALLMCLTMYHKECANRTRHLEDFRTQDLRRLYGASSSSSSERAFMKTLDSGHHSLKNCS